MAPPHVDSGERRPDMNMIALIVTSPAGAIVAFGVVVMGWVGLPQLRPFILGTVILGPLVGLALWWKHR